MYHHCHFNNLTAHHPLAESLDVLTYDNCNEGILIHHHPRCIVKNIRETAHTHYFIKAFGFSF